LQLGPNVSIGKYVNIGEGVRVRESIILEGATLQVSVNISERESIISGSYGTVVVQLKNWRRKLVEIARECTLS
jgi:UDP-3-O-[3-hydroxymyristoyl] glucosamine N-acyltransferase